MKPRLLNLPYKWLIFTVTATGTFMGTLDGGIVNIALPSIAKQFNADIESIQAVVSIYLLAVTCFLPVFGKLSDMYSRKKLYLGGFFMFGVGSVMCSLATSLPMLIIARAVQGLSSSAMMANSQAIIAKAFCGKDRGRALGGIGAVVALGSLAGPAVGGFLIQHFGWPSVFWVNIPVCAIGIWRGVQLIPRVNPKCKMRMDLWGAVFFIIACFSFLYALNEGPSKHWDSPLILGGFAAAVVFFGLFYYRERVSKTPFIGLSIFKIPAISYGYAVADAHFEERNHFLGDHATLDEVCAVNSLRMQKSDRHRDTCFLVHDRRFDCRDTGVVRQVSLSNGRGVVDDHATMVQQSLDDVDGVRRTAEVFLQLDHSTVRVGQRNVIPCVDVDLVEVSRTEERSEDGVFHHLRIQAVDELFLCEAVDEEATVEDIFLNIRLELVVLLLVGECRCVVFCDILLCFSEEVIKFNPYHTPPPDRQYLSCGSQSVYPRFSQRACLAASVL